jgi:UDP-N-acetylmuramoylalanine--D-glutamate ligase
VTRPPVPGGPFLVLGLGRSGRAAALVLRNRGEAVVACDAGSPDVAELSQAGVEVHLETSGEDLVADAAAVVKSPGVPAEVPAVREARAAGIPVLGELELGWRLLSNRFVAVTGTNGKTTTAELIGEIHRQAGLPVAVAGNVGTALCSLVGALDPDATVVCEASSFQLEDAEWFAPEVAVLVNLGADHLDRHGSAADYHAAKLRIFAHQRVGAAAVAPCAIVRRALPGAARRLCFGSDPDADLACRAGALWWGETRLVGVEEVRMRGAHNLENAMAGAAACLAAGVGIDGVREGLRSFRGVPHRLEEVARRGGVVYVNDSKATNVASTTVALASFAPGSVHVILGGRGKGEGFAQLRAPVARACRGAYLIGEEAAALANALADVGVAIEHAQTLERAVEAAASRAREGEVVLLSPACTSYDQFADFEERGDRFRELATRA